MKHIKNIFRAIKLWHIRRKRRAEQKRMEKLRIEMEEFARFLEVLSQVSKCAAFHMREYGSSNAAIVMSRGRLLSAHEYTIQTDGQKSVIQIHADEAGAAENP